MTTLNEREVFERVLSSLDFIDFANLMSVEELIRLGFHEAWQHQQKRIEFWQKDSATAWDKCEERRLDNNALQAQRVLLEKQNTIAVNALESINKLASMRIGTIAYEVEKQAAEALAEIKKIGE